MTLCQDVRYAARVLLKSPGLTAVAVIAVALLRGAVLCGADDFTEIEEFGQTREAWLRRLGFG